MPSLKGTETEQNLKDAFAGEGQANCRHLYFAQKADVEGFNVVAAVCRSTAETGHAHGHLEHLKEVDDPATGKPIGPTGDNLKVAIASETHRRVSGDGARGPPGRLRRDRRLVRDARQGREVACRPLPKGARRKLEHDRRETWTQRLTRKRASAQSCTGRQMLE